MARKLIALVDRLNGVEKREFTKFLDSPFYNKKEVLCTYWRYFLKEHGKKGVKFNIEYIYGKLYPKQIFDLKKFRHASSGLLKKIEQFLVVRQAQDSPLDYQLNLARIYRQKKLEDNFQSNLSSAKKLLNQQLIEPERFLAAYQLEHEQYAHIESLKRTATNNLQGLNDSLDQYLIISKLKQSCLMLAHQAVYQVNYDFSFLNVLLAFLKENPLLQNPAIGLYYHCYRAFSENDTTHFKVFKQLLTAHRDSFSPKETSGLLLFALNFCIRKINEGDQYFAREAWDFYILGLEQQLFYENNFLGRFTYKNIVTLGLQLRQYDWTENFIEEHKKDLNPKFQQIFYIYNKAKFHFTQKQYDQAMPLLAIIDDTDMLLNFDAKVILIKMYYELKEWDALYSLLDSFSAMIRRKKVIGYHKAYYKDLIQLTKQLIELPPGRNAKRNLLIASIKEKDKFQEKDWFLKKAQG